MSSVCLVSKETHSNSFLICSLFEQVAVGSELLVKVEKYSVFSDQYSEQDQDASRLGRLVVKLAARNWKVEAKTKHRQGTNNKD